MGSKLAVRNVLRIKKADIDLEDGQIALVGGLNDQGKSSLIQAAGAVTTGQPFIRTVTSKGKGVLLVRDGTKSGRVIFGNSAGGTELGYPECTKETKGTPPAEGHPLAVGTASLATMPPTERMAVMTGLLKAWPTHNDLIHYLQGHGVQAKSDKLWAKIEMDGWDVVHGTLKTHGTKLKAMWEQISGTRWGKNKAESWVPDGFDYDEAVNYEKVAGTRQQILEAAIANEAVSEERLGALRATVEAGAEAAKSLTTAPADLDVLEKELEGLVAIVEACPLDPALTREMRCPHCGKISVLHKKKPNAQLELPPPKVVLDADLKKQREVYARATGAVLNCEARINAQQNRMTMCQRAIEAADRADAELAKVDTGQESAGDVEKARADLAEAQVDLQHFRVMTAATEKHRAIVNNQVVIDAVGPGGARQIPITKALAKFNDELARPVAHLTPFPPVKLEDEMAVTVGGRPFALESESNQMRANIALQCVIAAYAPPPLLVVDRLDLLTSDRRKGVLMALAATRHPVLITMTARSEEVLPSLQKAKIGRCYWMEDGELTALDK